MQTGQADNLISLRIAKKGSHEASLHQTLFEMARVITPFIATVLMAFDAMSVLSDSERDTSTGATTRC